MTRRGLLTHFCFFNLGGHCPRTGRDGSGAPPLAEVRQLAPRTLYQRAFEEVVGEILGKVDNSQMGVVLKRMMLRAATRIAEDLHIDALVTGEAISQVSSQTLPTSGDRRGHRHLVLRPLIAAHKQDIIDTAPRRSAPPTTPRTCLNTAG